MVGNRKCWLRDYPHVFQYRDTTLRLQACVPEATNQAFRMLIDEKPTAKRVSAPLGCDESAYFIKRDRLDSLKKKWRVQRGRAKRNGTYDWPLEELLNTREARRRGAPVPDLVGYGYSRSKLGLVQDFFLITRLLTGHVDGFKKVRNAPDSLERVIRASFELLHTLHSLGITHMDLWAANVMLPEQGSAQAIDMENCFFTPTDYLAETLGFQFGFFYFREIYRYVTEAAYDAQVAQALVRYFPDVDRDSFARVYEIAKHEEIGRMKRREIFQNGAIAGRWD
ncbi:TPA: hypothetical protein QEM72_004284 [Pseudomonas putida]|nr:hypothetical protein [Pseudomonas putida]